jgi:hypothetical protein
VKGGPVGPHAYAVTEDLLSRNPSSTKPGTKTSRNTRNRATRGSVDVTDLSQCHHDRGRAGNKVQNNFSQTASLGVSRRRMVRS